MLHLHTERLAALGDDLPTAEEAAHLAACDACAHEVTAYQTLVAMAHAEREPFGLPLTRWESIAAGLATETPDARDVPARRSNRWMLQIAAGILLVAGGAMAGRVTVGAGPLPDKTIATTPAPNTAARTARLDSDSATFATAEEARAAQQRD